MTLQIDRVSKHFPVRDAAPKIVFNDISLDIPAGSFVSLIGPSGCGKSTLLEIIAGLQAPTAGRVLIDGKPISGPGPDRAVVFQNYALFPWRNVLENVALPLEVAGTSRAERHRLAGDRLAEVGLSAFASYFPAQLSGGMRQRVALARAFVRDPDVLLMDEPFGALDAITRDVLQVQLGALHAQEGKTIVLVTHSVAEAIRLSDRIVVMGIAPARIVGVFNLGPREDSSIAAFTTREVQHAHLRDEIWDLLRDNGAMEAMR